MSEILVFYSNKDGSEARGKVLGFVDYWPGYEPADISVNEDGGGCKTGEPSDYCKPVYALGVLGCDTV